MKKRYKWIKEDESINDALMRLSNWTSRMNTCAFIEELKTIEQLFDFWTMVHVKYDTDDIDAVYELITYEKANPKYLKDFIKKYTLNWDMPEPLEEGE